jgi:hypothetical protein
MMTVPELTAHLRDAGLWPADEPLPLTLTVAQYHRITSEGVKSIYEDCRTGRIPHRTAGKRNLVQILTVPALSLFFNGAGAMPTNGAPRDR